MLLPNSSASKEVSGSHGDNADMTLCGRSMCIYCTCRQIYSYVNRHLYVEAHMHLHITIPSPLLTSHYSPSYSQIVRVWMKQFGWCAASSWQWQCSNSWLPFLPNDAARAKDIWMSYIASLISAYAKLSFFCLSLSAGDLRFMGNTSYIHLPWQP